MSYELSKNIKNSLEESYDIPFDVHEKRDFEDISLLIIPHNDGQELFAVNVRLKNRIRLIVEVTPEKYSAFAIHDMAAASNEKKALFIKFAQRIKELNAKTDFYINELLCEIDDIKTWPDEWNSYKIRITKSPISTDDESYNEESIITFWAKLVVGMVLALLNVVQLDDKNYAEGGVKRVEVNRYERNPINRELCLATNGYFCKICGFDFEKQYGELGRRFIHVHHIVPVSEYKEEYIIDPTIDLIPVCPNCHAMLHRTTPPLMPDELKKLIRNLSHEGNEK